MKSLFNKGNWTTSIESPDLLPDEAPSFYMLAGSSVGNDNRSRRAIYKKLVMAAFRTYLNDEQRDMISKYYFEKKTIYQLSDELNISPAAVSKRIQKARKTIHSFAEACLNSGLFNDN